MGVLLCVHTRFYCGKKENLFYFHDLQQICNDNEFDSRPGVDIRNRFIMQCFVRANTQSG